MPFTTSPSSGGISESTLSHVHAASVHVFVFAIEVVDFLVLVEMFKAHLVMIQRKSANPYARET